jgi:hypothetical protein
MNGDVRSRGDLFAISPRQLGIGWRLFEVVVADQAAERLAAELAVLRLVDLLNSGLWSQARALVTLQRLCRDPAC